VKLTYFWLEILAGGEKDKRYCWDVRIQKNKISLYYLRLVKTVMYIT